MSDNSATIKKGRKFDQVLVGARTVFLRDGFDGASVDDIAREAGVSKATLYSYFPDKRVLFLEVAGVEAHRQADAFQDKMDETQHPRDLLPFAGREILDFILSDFGRAVFRIAVAESERFPEIGQKFYDYGPGLVKSRLMHYFESCIARNELVIDDLELAAEQFAELCKARSLNICILQVQPDVAPDERQHIVNSATEMFLARYGTKH